jgi:hypothetical protein
MNVVVNNMVGRVTRMLVIILTSAFVAQPISAQSKEVQPIQCAASSVEGLREVWDRYVEGLKQGDVARLRSIFADQGTFHLLSKPAGNGIETVSAQTFSEALPLWVANPDSTADGSIGTLTVDYNMATIRGTLDFGLDRFTDVLSLYCVNGRWQIVGKLTRGRLREAR